MTNDTAVFAPVDQVASGDERVAYLVDRGWTVDGKHLRWEGRGKRTPAQAREEQHTAEIRQAAE